MKKLLIMAVVAILFVGTASAQRRGGNRQPMTVKERVEMLDKVLNLTDDQEKKVTELYEAVEAKNLRGTERRNEIQSVREEVKKLLTEEQQKLFDDYCNNCRTDCNRPRRGCCR